MTDLGSRPASGGRTATVVAQAFWRAEIARWKLLLEAAGPLVD